MGFLVLTLTLEMDHKFLFYKTNRKPSFKIVNQSSAA